MPSIQDVADQVNAKLDQINANTAATKTNTAQTRDEQIATNARLDTMSTIMADGFTNLAAGLFAIHELQGVMAKLLAHHTKQNDTLICLMENNNELLCDIKRKFASQLVLSEALLTSTTRIEGISERVNGDEAIAYDRNQETLAAVKKCCPDDPPKPEPCPDPCKVAQPKLPRPDGQDWEPIKIDVQTDRPDKPSPNKPRPKG